MTEETGTEQVRRTEQRKPLLFISHRHADREIADALRRFITDRSGGRVAVFQSSSAEADDRPRVGRELQQELKEHLWEATVVCLVFTSPDEDWSYCMWECGVATLADPETRIIVLQCGSQPPQVYSDAVRVLARDLNSVQNFVTEFLTSEEFFPGYREAIAPGFSPTGQEVQHAGEQLHQSLHDMIVEDGEGEDWATVPFMRLQLSYSDVDRIRELDDQAGARAVLESARVAVIDNEAMRLFGLGRVEPMQTLMALVQAWARRRPDASPAWVDELATQVKEGSHWAFPRFRWQLMNGVDPADRSKYAPILSRVRSIPRQRIHEFDVYFSKFDTDDDGALRIAFVDEPQVQVPMVASITAVED